MNGEDVRLWEFWNAAVARLNSARMQQLLRGPARVYTVTGAPAEPEAGEADVWGRLVLVPARTLWPTPHVPGETRKVAFMARAEVHAPAGAAGFDAARLLDAVQAEVYAQLNGWTPPPFQHALVALPVYMEAPPDPLPLWDDARGLWFTSGQWRTEFAPAPGD